MRSQSSSALQPLLLFTLPISLILPHITHLNSCEQKLSQGLNRYEQTSFSMRLRLAIGVDINRPDWMADAIKSSTSWPSWLPHSSHDDPQQAANRDNHGVTSIFTLDGLIARLAQGESTRPTNWKSRPAGAHLAMPLILLTTSHVFRIPFGRVCIILTTSSTYRTR